MIPTSRREDAPRRSERRRTRLSASIIALALVPALLGAATVVTAQAPSSPPTLSRLAGTSVCATMCYMSGTEPRPGRVGVRELRQNLSVYLDRVKRGETLEVTEHGQPVAQLGPRRSASISILDQMIADGRATAATVDHRTIRLPARIQDAAGPTLSDILREMRDEEYR